MKGIVYSLLCTSHSLNIHLTRFLARFLTRIFNSLLTRILLAFNLPFNLLSLLHCQKCIAAGRGENIALECSGKNETLFVQVLTVWALSMCKNYQLTCFLKK